MTLNQMRSGPPVENEVVRRSRTRTRTAFGRRCLLTFAHLAYSPLSSPHQWTALYTPSNRYCSQQRSRLTIPSVSSHRSASQHDPSACVNDGNVTSGLRNKIPLLLLLHARCRRCTSPSHRAAPLPPIHTKSPSLSDCGALPIPRPPRTHHHPQDFSTVCIIRGSKTPRAPFRRAAHYVPEPPFGLSEPKDGWYDAPQHVTIVCRISADRVRRGYSREGAGWLDWRDARDAVYAVQDCGQWQLWRGVPDETVALGRGCSD